MTAGMSLPGSPLSYVVSFDPARRHNDEMAVVDLEKGPLTFVAQNDCPVDPKDLGQSRIVWTF
jgi:hypothetical protein